MASSTITLQLPRSQRRRLQRRAATTQDKVEFRRCQIVLQWVTEIKPAEIAQRLGCAVCTVYRTVSAFRQQGESALRHRTSPGRPCKVTPEQDAELDRNRRPARRRRARSTDRKRG